ncbi:MAG TPA: hypothetical protein VLA34_14850, partial [Candidatus Krumholzibacterium sp.]|nr:hypothetical protein [Candidatus Krumholzibacterium sp.]
EYTDWDGDVMWHGGWEGLTENSQFYTVWNVRDYFQNPVPNGIYGATYTAYEPGTDEEIFKGTAWFAVWTDMDMYAASIGVTGPDGSFTTRNKELFGFLQGHQPMTSTDGVGVGADFGFSPAVTFVATTPPPPGGTGYIYWMRREVTLIDGPNDFEWVFVPDDSVFVAPDAQ